MEYLPGDTLLVLDEPVRLKEAAVGASMEIGEHFSQLLRKGRILSSLADLYWDWNSFGPSSRLTGPFTFPPWASG